VAGDIVEELLGRFGNGRVRGSLGFAEEENEEEEERGGEKKRPEIGQEVEEPGCQEEEREDRETHQECASDLVPELQQFLFDFH